MLMAKNFPSNAKPHLASFATYSPGKAASEVEREFGLTDVLKLASNENALGMSPLARKAIEGALADGAIYPDTNCGELIAEIARRNRLPAECVMAGNGAVELIYYLAQCFLSPGEEAVTSRTTFSAYTIASRIQDAVVRTAPLAGYHYDLEAIRRLVTDRTRLVFIANPNNPTGTYLPFAAIQALARRLPAYVMLVLDEAYFDFVADPAYAGSAGLVRDGLNVVVLRSLSKSLGLAGLRIGYALAREDTIRTLRQVQIPFHVNILAQRAALAGLGDDDHLRRTLESVRAGRALLQGELDRAGLGYAPTEANFIWIRTGVDSQALFQKLLARGVIVRPGGGFGESDHIRVTIGLPDQNRRFVAALLACLGELRKG